MAEAERPQKRAQRRRRHHPMRQDPLRAPRTKNIGMVDVRGAGHDGMHQGQDLAARQRATDPADQAHRGVHQALQVEPEDQGADQQQAGIGHQVRIVEAHRDPVHRVRYSVH
jgi:hypothetical protein